MFIIGELINGMYIKIAAAIKERNQEVIQSCAKSQIACGADALDISCGTASKDPLKDMPWLVETVQAITNKPLCLDSSKPKVIAEGLKVSRNPTIINSTTADAEKLDLLLPLAKQYKSKLIGITIDAKGIPQNKDQRLELAAFILAQAQAHDFPLENLYLDPIVMPVNVAQNQIPDILETIAELRMLSAPRVHTLIGLSNVSQGAKHRSLLNRTFLTMAVASGLDSAILDPEDKELLDALITAELLLGKNIYCDSFLEAYRKK